MNAIATIVTAAEVISEIGVRLDLRIEAYEGDRNRHGRDMARELGKITLRVTGERSITATMGSGWLAGVWSHLAGETLDSQIVPMDTAYISQTGERTHTLTW